MFSGDIGRLDLPILRDPVLPEDIDYLIMECTYGDRSHNPPDQAYEELQEVITRTVEREGKVIIPAFAVGRTQTLVYYLHQMIERGDIPSIPVFVDSPLAINVTDIFRAHPECYDQEMLVFMQEQYGSAFGFDLHHLRNNIGDSRNTILITSWMAPHTLGRRLLEGQKRVKIFGEKHKVRAEVACINGLSSHGGQDYLLTYALATRNRVQQIFLVHGEPRAAMALTEKLAEVGLAQVHYPALGDQVEI
jgi:metallo-beta-lactamase family protein